MGDISRGGNGEESSVRLVMSCDARYVVPLAVTLRSLCRWHRESQPMLAYVLFDGVDEAIQRRVTASVGTGIRIHWIPAALEATAGLPIGHHFSRAVFAKITLGTALPADARRVVYLDADILVRRPIDPLFRVELGAASVGAVVDTLAGTVAHPGGVKAWRTVGLDGRTRMVNAGVLVVDLDRWRAANLDRRLIECAQRIGGDKKDLRSRRSDDGDFRQAMPHGAALERAWRADGASLSHANEQTFQLPALGPAQRIENGTSRQLRRRR